MATRVPSETIGDFYIGKEILITGGTGSLGKIICKNLLKNHETKGIRIFSRDEQKHHQMKHELVNSDLSGNVAFLIGDIRDKRRLDRAMNGVDIVFHTAAMKHVPACEYNPIEAVRTNVDGAINVLDCAINNNVEYVMNIATDKGVYPVNLYGCTKATAEKLFIHGNIYSKGTKFSCCRYGNVLASKGSVIHLFKDQYKRDKIIKVTHKDMTRFWITLDQVAQFVIDRCSETLGGDIFVPKMKSMRLMDLAEIIAPGAQILEIGLRQGEKLHESLITKEESHHSLDCKDYYVIRPLEWYNPSVEFTYNSLSNKLYYTKKEMKELIK